MKQSVFTIDEPGCHLFATCEIAGGFVAKDAILSLQAGDYVVLRAETDNEHDPFAVAIYLGDRRIGYVPGRTGDNINKLVAAVISSIPLVAVVGVVNHDDGVHLRNRIRLSIYARCL
jgi:hypothetical protein